MSQHDMDVANGAGALVRADINAALQALASLQSGPGDPAVTYPYQYKANTTTGYLQQRNPGNDAWYDVRLLDSRILASAAGSDAYAVTFAPAINAYKDGLIYPFRADVANTGACTFEANAVDPVPIKKLSNGSYVDLAAGDIPANHLCFMIYSATPAAMVLINPNMAVAAIPAIRGDSANLVVTVASDTTFTVTADEVTLKNASGQPVILGPLNLTSLNLSEEASIGVANGIKSAVLGVSIWYYPYVIYNGTTAALWLDTSPTTPTPPAGYTYWTRCSALLTDASAHFVKTKYSGDTRKAQYINVSGLPVVASGSTGSPTTPTYAAILLSSYLPPTAKEVIAFLIAPTATVIVAPNGNYGAIASTTNPPPVISGSGTGAGIRLPFNFLLESTSIYWASNDAGAKIFILGWKE